jgi:hypothetical protein
MVNLSHVRPSLTWGYQKYRGKIPSLIVIARVAVIFVSSYCIFFWFSMRDRIKIELAKVWIIKYFNILLIDKLSLLNIKGININIFISRASHS